MPPLDLQSLCQRGQELLMAMHYIEAERALVEAERLALDARDFDTLARLYMPLQETRRQRRQRCGEGTVCLDLVAAGPDDRLDGTRIIEEIPHGQLLVAGWGSLEPALEIRRLQAERGLFVETFLAAAYPVGSRRAVAIVPRPNVRLPSPDPRSIDELLPLLPSHSIVVADVELPPGRRPGDDRTYAQVMDLWERLHTPFLAAADMLVDPRRRIDAYRSVIRVDYACELAHQKLSDTARDLARGNRAGDGPAL